VRVIPPPGCCEKQLRVTSCENVELDSIVCSAGWKARNSLHIYNFRYKCFNKSKTPVDGRMHINGLKNFRGYA